ncbi:iron chelate uptake ABC transporter family permease subunit [Celeribacter indicus]|uniref:Iron ABC transporter permease n=1 Tax=Celeribacter indicus TaxID=1208324 RepID=A0A0B5DWM9_9RHOB|nr:iron chelate uptake ABC transporter family permease subunit [Celeribacter indicus]AJE45540.1 iron ABC transporter permease [Celeribacter indicus]SDW86467.1 iron complex transport system permease protein [Celeribacter indicus]
MPVASRPLILTGLVTLLAAGAFMTLGARGNWDFVLTFRGGKLLALVTVAVAVALSTVVFQTLTANRILTPSIMGFDALYLLLQTLLVFSLTGAGYAGLPPLAKFAAEVVLMLGASLALFGMVLRDARDLSRLVLTGIIFGVLFRSLTGLLNRMIDPSEYSVVQSASFARFTSADPSLTWIAALVTAGCGLLLFVRARRLDVLALGRDSAVSLGLDHAGETRVLLVVVALLVSVSTALVGPVIFFGLLVSALTYRLAGTWRHRVLLPLSCLVSAAMLILGQTLFERVLSLQTSVSVVIEALGGLLFLMLILKGRT